MIYIFNFNKIIKEFLIKHILQLNSNKPFNHTSVKLL